MADTAIPEEEEERRPKLEPRFVLRLDETTYEVLRDYAYKRHVPMTEVVRHALRAYLKDHL